MLSSARRDPLNRVYHHLALCQDQSGSRRRRALSKKEFKEYEEYEERLIRARSARTPLAPRVPDLLNSLYSSYSLYSSLSQRNTASMIEKSSLRCGDPRTRST